MTSLLMIRYICTIFSLFLLSASLSAQESKPLVVASASIFADMTHQIAGNLIEIRSIVPIGGDPHVYEPTPSDVQLVTKADLILVNGLTFEGWINELIENSGSTAEVVTITEGIRAITSQKYHNSSDPHAWMDASNGLIYIDNIKNALKKILPKHGLIIEQNYEAYRRKLENLDQEIFKSIQSIPEKQRILITSHDAFSYYGQRYGVRLEALIGISTDAEIKTSDVKRVSQLIRDNNIPAIFVESTINPKILKQIAQDNDISIGGELFADSVDSEGKPAGTYYGMLDHNTKTIVEALKSNIYSDTSNEGESSPLYNAILYGIIAMLLLGGMALMFWQINPNTNDIEIAPSEHTITVKGLSVSYDHKRVLTNINLELKPNSIYGVIGPNGAGKSTLFKAILQLIDTNSGTINVLGLDINTIRKKMAYVPQRDEVDWNFPATVLDIVLQGRYPHKRLLEKINNKDREIATQALKDLGIEDLKDRQIGQLSGGQQQRVFIARALAQEAEIFFLDEPFVGVDIMTEEKIIEILKRLRDENKTLLVVHHDLSTVEKYFDHVILLNQRLIACGKTSELFNPENIAKTYGPQLTILHKTGLLKV